MKTFPRIIRKVPKEMNSRNFELEVLKNRCTQRLEMLNDCSDNATGDERSSLTLDEDTMITEKFNMKFSIAIMLHKTTNRMYIH